MNASQRQAVLIGAAMAVVGLVVGLVPVRAANNVDSFSCGPAFWPRDFDLDQFCADPVNGRLTLALVLLVGGLAVAVGGWLLLRRE